MKSNPTEENAAAWFNAKTVTHHFDVVDRQAASIVDTRTTEGSTVWFYNADGFEFMTLRSDNVSTRFDALFGEKLVGARHARSPLASSRSRTCRWARFASSGVA